MTVVRLHAVRKESGSDEAMVSGLTRQCHNRGPEKEEEQDWKEPRNKVTAVIRHGVREA